MNKQLLFAALTAVLFAGCSKENTAVPEGSNTPQGKFVGVTLPVQVADATVTPPSAMSQGVPGASAAIGAGEDAPTRSANALPEGFTVSFDEPTTATGEASVGNTAGTAAIATGTRGVATSAATHSPATSATPATRTLTSQLTNVWVLQFDASGKNVSTTNAGTLAAGAYLTAPSLQVGTGYTICIVANGPASGLTTSNPATLTAFESTMLHKDAVTDATKLPLSGKLTNVTVIDLGDGKGRVSVPEPMAAKVVLNRIHAEVTLTVNFGVTDYTLTGAELYKVPVGATYGWNSSTTTFPDNTAAANFSYTDLTAAGLTPVSTSTSGTKTTFKWFTGDNRRGEVAGLTAQIDRDSTNAPVYATFARITLTNDTLSSKKLFYDVYLGSGAVTNFDVKRNMTYTQTATIKGSAAFQEALIDTDARVSGAGFPISLTDSKADSPFLISPKSMESTSSMIWGPTTATGITDIYDGKGNTDKIMALGTASQYAAAQHCRKQGAEWNLPAQVQLMLMWIYLPAIPAADRPNGRDFWSGTESSDGSSYAWRVAFLNGSANNSDKSSNVYVRCVREY